jgi:hypothetical protein
MMRRTKTWMTRNYDWRIPSAIKEEYYNAVLTAEQVLFLAEIESLCQHGKYHKYGCFATNQWLADSEGCSVRRIQEKLSELAAMDFLIITWHKGRRFIKTCWTDAERKAVRLRQKRRNQARKPQE